MTEAVCQVCGRPDGAGHESYCVSATDWLVERSKGVILTMPKEPQTQKVISPVDIIKKEVSLMVEAINYPERSRADKSWSATSAEYKIRMALNQLTHKEK